MKFTTLICTAAFLAIVIYGDYDRPRFYRAREQKAENREKLQGLEEIDSRISEMRSIISSLERGEKILSQRLREIEQGYNLSRGRRRSYPSGEECGTDILEKQIDELQVERKSALALLERLKTERVRLLVRRDLVKSSTDRQGIDEFLGRVENRKSPLGSIAEDLEKSSREIGGDLYAQEF